MVTIYNLREDDYEKVVSLGDLIFEKGYLDTPKVQDVHRRGCSKGLSTSFVMYEDRRENSDLIGFRLTKAPGNWNIDEWCSSDQWKVPPEKVCYFKSNCIRTDYSGQGLGQILLQKSIDIVKQLNGEAGLAHIWLNSPNNSAKKYFEKAGGEFIKVWPKWKESFEEAERVTPGRWSKEDIWAAEMILYF